MAFSDGRCLGAAEIVPKDDIIGSQNRHQDMHGIGLEHGSIDRPIDHQGGDDAVPVQGRDKGHASAFRSDQSRSCLEPVPERGAADQALAARSPTAQRGHVGAAPGFVNEHKPLQVNPALMRLPAPTLAGLAPMTRQSGHWRGKSFNQGGRAILRQTIYMPALVAIRFNPPLRARYDTLRAAGKPAKPP